MASATDYAPLMRDVAIRLLGDPNPHMTTRDELRYGSHGSLSIDLKAGTWFDHSEKKGGGVLGLIQRETGRSNGEAVEWLETERLLVPEASPNHSPAAQRDAPSGKKQVEATYDYVDETGQLLFQTIRYVFIGHDGAPLRADDGKVRKTFGQRRRATDADRAPDSGVTVFHGFVYSVKGIRQVPYRLPDIQEAMALDRAVVIVEGEKCADALWNIGIPATCNAMGAGKFPEELLEYFRGAPVVILPDNDDHGRRHADMVGRSLQGVAAGVRVLDLPGLPAKGDVVDWLDGGGTPAEFNELLETRAVAWAPGGAVAPAPGLHFGAVWFADVGARVAPPKWLVYDMLTAGDKSMVYGASGSGKSFFATHVSMGVATGVDVFGHKVRRGGVVYLAGEGKNGFRLRLDAYRRQYLGDDAKGVPFLLIPAAIDLFAGTEQLSLLLADLAVVSGDMNRMGVGLDLIVVDTLWASSPGADENAGKDMAKIIKNCERLQEISAAHVMLVHHKNAGGEKARGHTSLPATVDNSIEVSVDDYKNRTARIAKMKDGEDGERIPFRLQSIRLGTRDDGKDVTSCVVVQADKAAAVANKEAFKSLTPQTRNALDALRAALGAHGEPAPGALDLPYGVRVVKYSVWATYFAKISFEGGDGESKDEAVRKALQRSGEHLLSRRIIGRSNPYVWIVRELELNR